MITYLVLGAKVGDAFNFDANRRDLSLIPSYQAAFRNGTLEFQDHNLHSPPLQDTWATKFETERRVVERGIVDIYQGGGQDSARACACALT